MSKIKLENIVILITTMLIGVWATRNTIAARNILIGISFITSLILIYKQSHEKKFLKPNNQRNYWTQTSIILTLGLFIWIVIHYLFFSQFNEKQLNELTSTWLRAFAGFIIGTACGIAIIRSPTSAWALWLGPLISFIVLLCQYIPKAIIKQSLFAADYFGNYIYHGKYNGVLIGGIMYSGLLGLALDYLNNINNKLQIKKTLINTYLIFGTFSVLYAFIFIFDSKLGVGILLLTSIVYICILQSKLYKAKNQVQKILFITIIILIIIFALIYFENEIEWKNLSEDIMKSLEINKYQNWKNTSYYGYPVRENGDMVSGSIYERISFALLGIILIKENLIGSGVTQNMKAQASQENITFESANYSHSALIDFGLAYGIIGMTFIPLIIITILINNKREESNYFRYTKYLVSASILILFVFGEYGFKQSIEILLFFCGLLIGLSHSENK